MFTRKQEDQKESDWVEEYSKEVKFPIKVIPVKDWTIRKAIWYRLNKPLGWFSKAMLWALVCYIAFFLFCYFVYNNFIAK